MKQLELKHLAPYLPYGLKLVNKDPSSRYNESTLCDRSGLSNESLSNVLDNPDYFKPILRPLSDLTDNELHKFFNDNDIDIVRMKYAIVVNYKMMGDWFKETIPLVKVIEDDYSNLTMSAWLYMKLLENHYDLFGLIEKGLAIDKNSLAAHPTV